MAGWTAGWWVGGFLEEMDKHFPFCQRHPYTEAHRLLRSRTFFKIYSVIYIVDNINGNINIKACVITYQEINPEIKGLIFKG